MLGTDANISSACVIKEREREDGRWSREKEEVGRLVVEGGGGDDGGQDEGGNDAVTR